MSTSEPHMRSEIIMDSEFCPDIAQMVKMGEYLSQEERRQVAEMMRGSYEVTEDDVLRSMKRLKLVLIKSVFTFSNGL